MNDEKIKLTEAESEAAEGATSTTSESHDHAYHDEAEESAATVANPPTESKDDDSSATTSGAPTDDVGADEVVALHSSNPCSTNANGADAAAAVPSTSETPADQLATGNAGPIDGPLKKRGGRPKGSKNRVSKQKPAGKKPSEGTTQSVPPAEAGKPTSAQNSQVSKVPEHPPSLHWIDIATIARREPFSALLPINPETLAAVKESMQTDGFDETHPMHLWTSKGELILVDGHTRIAAAIEAGIARIPAFIHEFPDENAAVKFGIQCQTDRRNLTGGEMFTLIASYDKIFKPGSNQQRGHMGTFGPGASTDATGKSAEKTAKQLKTTATNVERARYLLKNADAATKDAIAKNKMTLSRACEVTRNRLAAPGVKNTNTAKTDTKKDQPSPISLTPDSDVAHAVWQPVACRRAEPPADTEARTDSEMEDEYVLVDKVLDLPDDWEKPSAHEAQRVLVTPGLDLFAEQVPAKIVRAVLLKAAAAKRYNFLFTTQNPGRLAEFPWEENTFAGVSIFGKKDIKPAEDALRGLEGPGKWLVVEQLTMELTFEHLDQLDWLVVRQGVRVVGAAMDQRAMKSLLGQAWVAHCPVLFERGIAYQPTEGPKAVAEVTNEEGTGHD